MLKLVLVRFNPATYTVTEGVNSTAVITLETIGAHPDTINVTVIARSGNATRELIYAAYEFSYAAFAFTYYRVHGMHE